MSKHEHIFQGNCPDPGGEMPSARDTACPACREMLAQEFGGDRLDLRDRFAMAALTGLLADHTMRCSWAEFAVGAYALADAMLAERAKRTERGAQTSEVAP